MTVSSQRYSVLLENVFSLIDKKVDNQNRTLITTFGRQLFKNIPLDDLEHRNDSDLYGATLSLWNAFANYDGQRPYVRVFNPEIDKHGWKSTHTIVELIIRDMPFLVDSIRMALNRLGITAHMLIHSPMNIDRDDAHQLVRFGESKATTNSRETVVFIEVDRQTSKADIDLLTKELFSTLDEVSLAVSDWQLMLDKLSAITAQVKKAKLPIANDRKDIAVRFLEWLNDHNFTLMGYRHYTIKAIEGDHQWHPDNESSLGLMKNSISDKARLLSAMPSSAQKAALSPQLLLLTKTNSRSRVHRPAYMDYVGIKEFNSKGQVIGEHRFLGLYSANFYNSSTRDIPLLSDKIRRICELSEFDPRTHAFKAFNNIVETYPRDELLQTPEEEMAEIVRGIFQMQERGITRLFVRKDTFGRFFSCMVYVPRERYNTQLRKETQALLQHSLGAAGEVEFTTFFSESVYARTHYIARVNDNNAEIDVKEIEQNIIELTKTWSDRLSTALSSAYGEATAKSLERKYVNAFSRSYTEHNLPTAALVDIEKLELLSEETNMGMLFYRPQEEQADSQIVKLKLFHLHEPIHLSDVLPILENFGLRVIDESPYKINCADGTVKWVMDFTMLHKSGNDLDMDKAQALFQDAFAKVWYNLLEDDGFNRLVLSAELTGRNVTILRAFAKYMRQTGSSFSRDYIANTLSNYPQIAGLLINYFEEIFNPTRKSRKKRLETLDSKINEALDKVSNLDDDRIIRRYLDLINATLRTNFYQKAQDGSDKPYISFKLLPEKIPEMPLPLPKYEIFVYSPKVEGVHLRGGRVARGGLRWSDRQEDFRTEILGLVKAQKVKNTVIVPVGAKGGFVCKQLPSGATRQEILEEGKACYRTFIRSLLDITDNIVNGEIVPPKDVVRLDEDDPYLVVAADKGTATFSDIANGISEEYNFWLGDAFASGGSVGYDHKKMGITARGGWESVKRHFREIGIDCQTTDFTCVGIGDMAGDVFGNGMLLSEHTRLVAAFNHLHIFFDPEPDAAKTYVERKRLFDNPSLSWDDYDRSLISKGGGIFNRSSKSITLTPEMKNWLGTRQSTMTPSELIHNILKMPVDLIWNGGIGTYVKSKKESHTDVGDRANDSLRVNGRDIRAKIVGEGGNLGLTQLGRMEYASNGGRVNTDFIDNVGGVDCSDNEVNIKILLNQLVSNGDLTVKQRNNLLYDMTDDVANIVLQDCYRQTQAISISERTGVSSIKEQLRFIHGLERDGALNRELEFIPSDDEISDRAASDRGLTRPELSVLTAYGKMVLKDQLNIPALTDNPYHGKLLISAFPPVLRERFAAQMQQHPLRAEIIATKLTNNMVNDMGHNFVYRMQEETGADIVEITNAYSVIKGVFGIGKLWDEIEDLDNKIDAQAQLAMLESARRLMRRGTRWYIRHGDSSKDIEASIQKYQPAVNDLCSNLANYLVKSEIKQLEDATAKWIDKGVPQDLASKVAAFSNMFSALDLTQIVEQDKHSIDVAARLYYQMGSKLELHWFLEQINTQAVGNHWQALARASYREELDWQQRSIVSNLLSSNADSKDADAILANWMQNNEGLLKRWYHMMSEFKTSSNHDFAKFSVALRELMLLSMKSNQ
ncbi:NAD-glutamate dehydrogenase [Alteromonas sp. AMM-1]|uniref:NAD-glutamate dehydrogenase n=1 Tax=Alteromonas sp. AMM-1 TaxID=3394233 RepID=UPI0039A42DC1